MLATTFFASQAQRVRLDGAVKFEKIWLIAAFLIHWFFIAFTKTGTDHAQYIDIITYKADFFLERGEEPGFNGMCIFLRKLIGDPEIILFIIKTLTLCLYYQAFWLLRDKAKMSYLMMTYNAGLYLWSFVVIAQTMAVSIILLGAAILVRGGKAYWSLLLSILAYSIHASAIVMVVVFLIIAMIKAPNIKIRGPLLFLMLVVVVYIVRNILVIYNWAINEFDSLAQYGAYDQTGNVGIGFFNYVLYMYLFITFVMPIMRNMKNDFLRDMTLVFFIYGFASAIIGYYIGSTRLNYYTYVFFLIIIPCYFFQVETKKISKNQSIPWQFQNASWVLYLLYIGVPTLIDASNPKSLSDMANYSLFNPFS